MESHPRTVTVPPGPRTDVTPPDAALVEEAGVQQLGNWIGGVPITLGKSYKVVAIAGIVALVALATAVGGGMSGGFGGVVTAVIAGVVALVAGAVSVASLVDAVRTQGRPAHVYERGMALPEGTGWYVVGWLSGRIEAVGGSFSPDGLLLENPISWTIGAVGADDHTSMVEPDEALTALYHHAAAQVAQFQREPTLADLHAGRPVTFGDLTLGPEFYRGSKGTGAWQALSRVWWSAEEGGILVEQLTASGPVVQTISDVGDSIPNLALVIDVMRAMAGASLR